MCVCVCVCVCMYVCVCVCSPPPPTTTTNQSDFFYEISGPTLHTNELLNVSFGIFLKYKCVFPKDRDGSLLSTGKAPILLVRAVFTAMTSQVLVPAA